MNKGLFFEVKCFLSEVKSRFDWLLPLAMIATSLCAFIANIELLQKGSFGFSSLCFALIFVVALIFSERIAVRIFIFLTPLLPTLNVQLSVFFGLTLSSLSMTGFDLVSGFFLAVLLKHIIYSLALRNTKSLRALMAPWPINIVLLLITLSTILAIERNAWSSATQINLSSIFLGIINSRGLGWFEDFRPLADWTSYVMALAVFSLVFNFSKTFSNSLPLIFKPLLAGLFVSGILAIIQSKTGLGFERPPTYIDIFGFAPYGFQPDLHSYAGYTLLGAVGLWGYYSTVKSQYERLFILLVIALSWYGLLASISKASIFFALLSSVAILFCWFSKVLKGNFILVVLKVGLLLLALACLFLVGALNDYLTAPHWLIRLHQVFSGLRWSNFSEISAAFSNRPGIWLAALQMWIHFPILGVGQGDFYQLSYFFNIANVPDLIQGENAHNYFLQTLTETGLVGFASFAVAILIPFFLVKDRRVLMPAAVALGSLFLGNIYAHSFLVRENLFLAAIFLGLMYSYIPQEKLALSPYKLLVSWKPKLPWKVILPLFCIVIVGLGSREVYKSFYSFPFQYGTLCFVNKPLTPDGWSSGLYEVPLPVGSHGVELSIKVARPNLQEFPLRANFEILDSENRVLASQAFEWRESGPQKLVISMPNGSTIQDSGAKVALRLSSCYTPRNLGESIDGRRLGVIVDSSIIH